MHNHQLSRFLGSGRIAGEPGSYTKGEPAGVELLDQF